MYEVNTRLLLLRGLIGKEARVSTDEARMLQKRRFSLAASAVIILLVLVSLLIIKDAWMCDDAYIAFRTVDNALHGYGLTWNVDERVQAFTSPLWTLLLIAFSFCVRNIYLTCLVLSLCCSISTLYLVAMKLARTPLMAILGLVALAASKTFVDFATSGLEDPLTYLLIALFAYVYFCYQDHPRAPLWLGLTAGLATLNRMDTLLLYAPALVTILIKKPTLKTLRSLAWGFAPFLLWEVFSLWYYGFPFPNTAYAKLDTGIPEGQLLVQGIGYLIASTLLFDPLILLALLAGLVMPLLSKDRRAIPLSLGILLYVAYTLFIGGDFMAGRFFAGPLLLAVILVVRLPVFSFRPGWAIAFGVVLLIGIFTPYSRWWWTFTPRLPMTALNIFDQRAWYADWTSIWRMGISQVPTFPWAQEGLQVRQSGQRVVVFGTIGFYGFNAGPTVHIVDIYALSDPLLARLPTLSDWKIGHFERALPPGYLATLESGNNVIENHDLALYYSKLEVVTRGNLWSLDRLVEIWKLNIGAYSSLLPGTAPIPALPPGGHIFLASLYALWLKKGGLRWATFWRA